MAESVVEAAVSVLLIRSGSKTDADLIDPNTQLPFVYPVVEKVTWWSTTSTALGVSLAAFGLEGLWKVGGIEEPLVNLWEFNPPYNYYNLPLSVGATALEAPHFPQED